MKFPLTLLLLALSSTFALPPPVPSTNRTTTTANNLHLPDPYDYRIVGALILHLYHYGNPIPYRDSFLCVRDAMLAVLHPIHHRGHMGTQRRRYPSGNVELVFEPDARITWEDWMAVLTAGLVRFVGEELGREFQFSVVMEGWEDDLGRGWVMLNRRDIDML